MASRRERRSLAKMRMFEGASNDRLVNSWDSQPWTIDQIIYSQLEALRARSREQVRNNTYLTRLGIVLQNNIVGANGVQVKPMVLDFQGGADKLARQVIKTGWVDFLDNTGLVDMELLIMLTMVSDGEAFITMESDENRNLVPTFLDPALIDINYNRNENGKNIIKFGIEYDAYSRPVRYWVNEDFSKYHPMVGNTGTGNIKRRSIPAGKMIHIFRKVWVGQTRGIPWGVVSLYDLFQVNKFKTAAVTAGRIGAAKMGFFFNEDGEEYSGDDESGDYSVNAEAGTFENIGNMKFEPFDPTYPAGEFEVFLNKVLQGVSAGLGIDAHTLTNDLSNVNYSSARVGMLETREYYKTLQNWLIRIFVRPLYQKWLATELIMGRLESGRITLSRGFDYYKPATFQGRRWDWVDPDKEMSGNQKAYGLRIKSISQMIRERGQDPEEVFQEISEEKKLLERLDISPNLVINKLNKEGGESNAKQTKN